MLSKSLLSLLLFGVLLFSQVFGQGETEGESNSESESSSSEGEDSEGSSSEGGENGEGGSGGSDTDDSSTSSSSSSSDSGACFASDSIVTRLIADSDSGSGSGSDSGSGSGSDNEWEYAMLKDIKLGDYVLSSVNGESMYTEVLHRLHYLENDGSNEAIEMKQLCTQSNCLTMTSDHLLYVNGNALDNLINAAQVNIGDLIYNQKENDFQVIVSVDDVMAYPRDVLTRNGNVIVNDILASSYIGTNKWDHIILETIMKSLHYLANDMTYLYDVIADGPSIWKNEEFTCKVHQSILFLYFNVYSAIINHAMSLFGCGFAALLLLQRK